MLLRIPKIFNETDLVYLVGGGASLQGFDFKKLEGKPHIAINYAYRFCPNASMAFSGDKRFMMEHIGAFARYYKGEYVVTSWQGATYEQDKESRLVIVPASMDRYFSHDAAQLGGHYNSGIQAINVAYLAGARRVVLLGYDCTKINGRGHYHNGYVCDTPEGSYARYADEFDALGAYLETAAPDLKIYNASPVSEIKSFEKVKLNDDLTIGESTALAMRVLDVMDDKKIAEIEEKKYRKMWGIKRYRKSSPAEKYGMDGFLSAFEFIGEGHLVADYGCGTGRVSRKLQQLGFVVVAVDITEKCFDAEVQPYVSSDDYDDKTMGSECIDGTQPIGFYKRALWDMRGVPSTDFFLCCDVMEHIPEEKVDAVLAEIASLTGVGGFFAIATKDDTHGKLIDEKLHLTVKDADWWGSKMLLHFNVKSVKIEDGRVEIAVTKKGE